MREELFKNCTLCPRKCNVNRLEGKRGYCGMDGTIRLPVPLFICGRNLVFQVKKDQGLFFSLAAACGAVSARTGILPLGIPEKNFSGAAC